MNNCILIGRLTRDVDLRYMGDTQKAVARFNLAINRGKDKGADFVPITVFGNQAENCDRYLRKGSMVGVEGSFTSGSYEKDGKIIYTYGITAHRVEFLSFGESKSGEQIQQSNFEEIDENVPF